MHDAGFALLPETQLRACLHGSGGPRSSGVKFLLFSRSGEHKTKETYPTRPGSPTPCKQGLREPHPFLCVQTGSYSGFDQ